ncbi:hypothetical protein BJ875DRAFT_480639 [Amylocarpus encephaloides]|uniref:Capsule polysaccharide biosynthesis protein n=1 Tax=Amylocarpus encephaloides TaxID=45428 RepID=A0A9P8C8W5_9HELO|nr:hypothetical protein BJ875DRAFT_480639 [Amylocarpus encephaloides]
MDLLQEALSYLMSSPKGILAGCIGLFGLLNLKSLPLFWHVRIFSAFFQQSKTSSLHDSSDILDLSQNLHTPLIFRPLITSTRCSILELDYVLHKSNSTYFTDLDVSRVHLLLALFKNGMAKLQKEENSNGNNKMVMPVLGGASASFRRAIPPFRKYDVVTRVLCWDEKWIYIVSWFVTTGSLGSVRRKKDEKISGPSGVGSKHEDGKQGHSESSKPVVPRSVYATSIAKYVVKAGSKTVKPESVMVASGLIPEGDSEEVKGMRANIEKGRLQALKYGRAFCELDGLHGEFDEDVDTLRSFRDLL